MERTVPYETLKLGSEGSLVETLQEVLTDLGYDCGPVDGVFDMRTESCVKSFQADQKLTIDGVVESETWGSLIRATKPPPLFSAKNILLVLGGYLLWKHYIKKKEE